MKRAIEYAKYIMKNIPESVQNTFDGNMKLQKLLVLADMANIAEKGEPLFEDDVYAFTNGCVVENVRLRYKNDFAGLKRASETYDPDFSEDEYRILNAVLGVFGHLSARKLSDLNHGFEAWKKSYSNGMAGTNGYHDKEKSIVDFNKFPEDIAAVGKAMEAHRRNEGKTSKCEVVNGVRFFYDGIEMTSELECELESFSKDCEDDAYTICYDNGKLVIY